MRVEIAHAEGGYFRENISAILPSFFACIGRRRRSPQSISSKGNTSMKIKTDVKAGIWNPQRAMRSPLLRNGSRPGHRFRAFVLSVQLRRPATSAARGEVEA